MIWIRRRLTSRRSQPASALPFTRKSRRLAESQVAGGSAFFVRRSATLYKNAIHSLWFVGGCHGSICESRQALG
jgi:hypothetical protein